MGYSLSFLKLGEDVILFKAHLTGNGVIKSSHCGFEMRADSGTNLKRASLCSSAS